MRKFCCVLLCLLALALPVLAEESASGLIFTGKVEAKDSVTLYAPFGGAVDDFSLQIGARVHVGDSLLTLKTNKVYAPCDGTVAGIFVSPGDSAAFAQSRYGALCYIEPQHSLVIQASTAQGYDSAANRFIHIGETVYLRNTSNTNRTGVGRVVAVSGQSYSVEVLYGELWVSDTVNIHRKDDHDSPSRIGRGTVSRVSPIAINAEGSVLVIAVRDGQTVQRGDLLFEMVSGALEGLLPVSPTVTTTREGIVAAIAVAAGQTVGKNQALVTLHCLERLRLVSSVNEVDAPQVNVGDTMSIEFDSIPGKRYEGIITSVSGIGTTSDNYTQYAVYIEFAPDESVRLGMSGTAYPVR